MEYEIDDMFTPLPSTYTNWSGKSEKNILASSLLIANELANQSVHCSYYSCVQYVFHVLNAQFGMETAEVERESKSWNNGVGTHRWLRDFIYESIKSKDELSADRFHKDMFEICKARNKADYSHQIVFEREAEKIRNKSISIINLLKLHYE